MEENTDVLMTEGIVSEGEAGLLPAAITDRVAKVELARHIATIISKRRLNQSEAARLLGVAQPKVSNLINGRLSGFSLERLIQFLNALGRDVQIVVKQREHRLTRGKLKVCGSS